jgi:hypothetical protein
MRAWRERGSEVRCGWVMGWLCMDTKVVKIIRGD